MSLFAIVRGKGESKSFVGKAQPVSRSTFDEFNYQKKLDGRARENSRIPSPQDQTTEPSASTTTARPRGRDQPVFHA